MDSFDHKDESLQPTKDRGAVIWNILTVLVLLTACCMTLGIAAIFFNPYMGYNPFPPPTLPPTITLPSETPTPKPGISPTWTPTSTFELTFTATPIPTLEPTQPPPTESLFPGAQLTLTPEADMPFVLNQGDPVAIPNIAHPDLGCNWMGIAGKAHNLSGAPIVQGLFIQLGGTLNGKAMDNMLGTTGMVAEYGPGGYEFTLEDKPIASTQTLWVQLFDQAMIPLSDRVYFDTYSDCNKNLILVNFSQIR